MSVLVYSTPTCPFCSKAKEFLKRNKVDFEDIDVSKNKQKAIEAVEKSGMYLVPIIDVNGTIIVGFDEARLSKELGLGMRKAAKAHAKPTSKPAKKAVKKAVKRSVAKRVKAQRKR